MVKAFGYTRVSGLGQVKGHGPERQREDISDYAKGNGIELVAFYEDAHTGTEADRPQFMAMLEAMMGDGVKVVIVESLDRFARELLVQLSLLGKLAAEGLTLIAANTGEDVTAAMKDDPMREALVQIQGVFAQLDKRMTVRRLKRAREAMRKLHGRCEGRKPFGINEQEVAALKRIRQLRRKPIKAVRLSVDRIAEILNAEGFRTRSGGLWTGAHVRQRLPEGMNLCGRPPAQPRADARLSWANMTGGVLPGMTDG